MDPRNCSVLVCEDDPAMVRIFQFLLRQQGIARILTLDRGEHVLQTLNREKPALMLLDLMLPGKDGLTVLREMKQDPSASLVPVIIVSGREAQEQVAQAMTAGAIDYVIKPFEPAELGMRIKTFLQSLPEPSASSSPSAKLGGAL